MDSFFSNQLLFGEEILNSLHIFAGTWLDRFMLTITFAGSNLFYTMTLPVLYWCWDRKKALYTGAVFLIAMSVNDTLKVLFSHPRPDPERLLPGIAELTARHRPRGPGFPSGHTQGSLAFWGAITYMARNRTVTVASALLIILVPYSRIYLGVHYLGDVIGGYLFGLLCLAAIIPAARFTEKHYRAFNTAILTSAVIVIPFIIFIAVPGDYINTTMGTISGFMTGALMAEGRIAFNTRNRPRNQIAKTVLGLSVVAALRFGLKRLLPGVPASGFFIYWLIGFWCSLGAPWVFSKIKGLQGDVGVL
ncbi:MAG: phosphatase PAP2 family protein [Spirochaetes bacterium]|nr:phosphatase PAP2 family protein [Spirochaetota bacterium]